jgi:acyl-CoA synthetase (AMP-forming)/AMP-acid ligase II
LTHFGPVPFQPTNTPPCQTPILTLGALWAGGIVSPANPLYTADELAFQLRDSGAKGLVTQPAYLTTALSAAEKAGLPAERVILLGPQRDPSGRTRHFSSIIGNNTAAGRDDYAAKSPVRWQPRSDLSFLVYSSGTTGLPKGVGLTHYNMVANVLQASYVEGSQWRSRGGPDGKGDKQLGILPFFHIYGLTCGVLMSVYEGWQLVVLERFDMEKALRTIERYRITFAYVPPPVVLAFSKHPAVERYDLSSLKVLHSGAAPLTRELTDAVWNRLRVPVKQGFGLSETSAVVCCQTVDEWGKFMGSVGKLMPNMEARIVGEDGEEVGEGEVSLFSNLTAFGLFVADSPAAR